MTHQIRFRLKAHGTVLALKGPIGGVKLQVRLEIAAAIEATPTQVTLVYATLPVNGQLMTLHRSLGGERLWTLWAFNETIQLHAFAYVRQQVALRGKEPAAEVTLAIKVIHMTREMSLQCRLIKEEAHTVAARIDLLTALGDADEGVTGGLLADVGAAAARVVAYRVVLAADATASSVLLSQLGLFMLQGNKRVIATLPRCNAVASL